MRNEKRAILIALTVILLTAILMPSAESAVMPSTTQGTCRVGYTMYPVFGVSYQVATEIAANFKLAIDPCPPVVAPAWISGYKIQIRRLR